MNKPKEGDVIDGKVVTGVYWPWVKFGDVCGKGWVNTETDKPSVVEEVKFNEKGDGVKVGDIHVRLEKCPRRGLIGGFTKSQEYKLIVWSTSGGEDRFWSGKRFTP